MGKLRLGKVLDCLCLTSGGGSCSCFCISTTNELDQDDEFETKPLITTSDKSHLPKVKDLLISNNQTLAFQLKPKMVVMRVSMHCGGCARKVKKHISKLEGVTSYKVDLDSKMVVVTGDIIPVEVLRSVSSVKNAELWDSPFV